MAEYYFSGSFAAAAGVTFKYSDLTARLGYRYASQWCIMPTRLAAGLGYSFDNISVNVSFAHMSTQNIVALGVVYKIQ